MVALAIIEKQKPKAKHTLSPKCSVRGFFQPVVQLAPSFAPRKPQVRCERRAERGRRTCLNNQYLHFIKSTNL